MAQEIKEKGIIPGLSEKKIARLVGKKIYARGSDYYERDLVLEVTSSEKKIWADVEGSQEDPYQVEIAFDEHDLSSLWCDCPYEEYCKHIVAVLLTCLHSPEEVELVGAVQEKLKKLNKEQLSEVIEYIAQTDGRLYRKVAKYLDKVAGMGRRDSDRHEGEGEEKLAADQEMYEEKAKRALSSMSRFKRSKLHRGVKKPHTRLSALIDEAYCAMGEDDPAGALVILRTLAKICTSGLADLDDFGGQSAVFFDSIDSAFAEAILLTDMSKDGRKEFLEEVEAWRDESLEYGIEEGFASTLLALEQGWDDEDVVKQLRGQTRYAGGKEEHDALEGGKTECDAYAALGKDGGIQPCCAERFYGHSFVKIRLKVLERQKRYEECGNFAAAHGFARDAISLLIEQGIYDKAVSLAKKTLTRANDVFEVAKKLSEYGDDHRALALGRHGLSCEGYSYDLAVWLYDMAQDLEDQECLHDVLIKLFETTPSVKSYQRVLRTAPKGKSDEVRQKMLSLTRKADKAFFAHDMIIIFLEEGLVEEAMGVIDSEEAGYQDSHLFNVMEAALGYDPAWAAAKGIERAEMIASKGKSLMYRNAAIALEGVKKAHEAMSREDEWRGLLAFFRERYKRKRKLMGLLDEYFGEQEKEYRL